MLFWSFLGFVCVLWIAKLQRDNTNAEAERRERQRAQRLGLAPIPGADGKYQPRSEEP